MKKRWSIALMSGVALIGYAARFEAQEPPAATTQATQAQPTATQDVETSGQPIAFPHNIHAGQNQIDCQYCHFSAERSMRAGIPPVSTCMGCHAFVNGTQNPQEVDKLRGYAERQEPIPWNRIYRVSDHVQFPHMRHIAAGVQCQTCHGEVQDIGVIQQVNQPLHMGWCISCHEERGASRDCTVCHY